MEIIPVLDIKAGIVVHARRGTRDEYAPLRSRLTRSVQPSAVLSALLTLHPFRRVYLADLDAISGEPSSHLPIIQELRQRFPEVEFWVDRGLADRNALDRFLEHGLGTPVLGSESLTDTSLLHLPQVGEAVLSLDYRGGRLLGPQGLEQAVADWPQRVILMELERVGADAGPDFEHLAALRRQAPGRRYYAAGGVRDDADVQRLEQMGVEGVLVASALHQGDLSAALVGTD